MARIQSLATQTTRYHTILDMVTSIRMKAEDRTLLEVDRTDSAEKLDMLQKALSVHPIALKSMLSSSKLSSMTMRRTWSVQETPNDSGTESDKNEEERESLSSPDLSEDLAEEVKEPEEKPKSIFRRREKYVIVVLGGLSGFWSSISSPIYVPALSQIEDSFHISESQANITIVVYSIFQGLGPNVFANLADTMGRRPIVLACLFMYLLASVGLALNSNFVGLIILRCIQAFGISSTISLGSGIASDITVRAERASFIGLTTGLALLGQAFGAFVGGMVSSRWGWRAIFWFLAIASGATLVVIFFLLPETGPSVVGIRADILPKKWKAVSVAPIMRTSLFRDRLNLDPDLEPAFESTRLPPHHNKGPFAMFKTLQILTYRRVFMTLLPASLCYALWLMMLTTLSHELTRNYGYSLNKVAIAYIPSGLGGLAGSIIIGRILDYSYKVYLRKSQITGTRFSVIRSRLVVSALLSSLCVFASLLFAWSLQYHSPVGLPVVASCIIAFGAMNWLTISSTVVVDFNPTEASGSCACVNLTRCWCAALFVGVLSQMEQMGVGWCYTLMAALCAIAAFGPLYLYIEDGKQDLSC